jgi:WD40 repeat protein
MLARLVTIALLFFASESIGHSQVKEAKFVRRLEADAIYRVAFSPDGLRLVSTGNDDTVRVWDVESGKEIKRFILDSPTAPGATFSPDGRLILVETIGLCCCGI